MDLIVRFPERRDEGYEIKEMKAKNDKK